jgi:sigma-B regulation protein RsbU (phosphoserine phosphatase)
LFFVIADVSGKGAPAALLMAATKEVIREAVLKYGVALDDILSEANQKTAIASTELEGEGGVFVTAFIGVLDLRSGRIIYTSAGHEAPFVVSRDRGLRQLITDGGPPLGAIAGFLYPIDRDRITPGEVLLLYTDGVTEAENADHTLYGRDRLAEALAKAPTNHARNLVEAMIDDIRNFVGQAEQADDVTVLALRLVARRAC